MRPRRTPFTILLLFLLGVGCTGTETAPTSPPTLTPTPTPTATPTPPALPTLQARIDSGDALALEVVDVQPGTESGIAFVILRAEDNRLLPIGIGSGQALSIALELEGAAFPRPLSHELLAEAIARLGGAVDHVIITELVDAAFHAVVVLRQGDAVLELDARPSDAIALALRVKAPIYGSARVLDQAASEPARPTRPPPVVS